MYRRWFSAEVDKRYPQRTYRFEDHSSNSSKGYRQMILMVCKSKTLIFESILCPSETAWDILTLILFDSMFKYLNARRLRKYIINIGFVSK